MSRMKSLCCAALLSGLVLAGCDTEQPTAIVKSGARRVAITLGPFPHAENNGVQEACVSVISDVRLTVTSEGGRERTYEQAMTPGTPTAFNITVEEGPVAFDAEVLSNNETLLYAGATTETIAEDDFRVQMMVAKRSPVLQGCPQESMLAYDRERNAFVGALRVDNIGTGLLTWNAVPPEDQCRRGPCLSLEIDEGENEEGTSTRLAMSGLREAENRAFNVRLNSPVGSVDLRVLTAGLPDLVAPALEVLAEPRLSGQDVFEVPVRVGVENQGHAAAEVFKVAVEYTVAGNTFVAPFTVDGEESRFYPFTDAPLAPGEAVTFEGVVVLLRSLVEGETITLRATADSCSGEEFVPDDCRIAESDEDNNQSEPVDVDIPIIIL